MGLSSASRPRPEERIFAIQMGVQTRERLQETLLTEINDQRLAIHLLTSKVAHPGL